METKKIALDGLEGKTLEFATAFNSVVDELEARNASIASLNSKVQVLEGKEVKNYDSEVENLKTAIKALEAKKPESTEKKTVAAWIESEIVSRNIKSLEDLKKLGNFEVESKADVVTLQSALTGDVSRTNMDATVRFSPVRKLAFLPRMKFVSEGTGKAIFGYTEGSYTSNAGYVGENAAPATNDTATATEKIRKYAKISAFQHVSTETFEDIPAFANALADKLLEGAMLFVDNESYSGNGVDITHPDHIYGILGSATALASASTFADSVFKPNVADLANAAKTQIALTNGAFSADTIWMNPLDVFKLTSKKDTAGQPIINKDYFGNPTLAGLTLVETTAVTADTMLIADSRVIEFRTKRSLTMKMGQVMTGDVENDRQSAILFARIQLLIRDLDKVAVVKVASIATALDDIEALS